MTVGLNHSSHSTGHSFQVICYTFWKVTLTLNLANPRLKGLRADYLPIYKHSQGN